MQRKEIKKSCANCGRYDPKKDCSELCFEEFEKWIPAEAQNMRWKNERIVCFSRGIYRGLTR